MRGGKGRVVAECVAAIIMTSTAGAAEPVTAPVITRSMIQQAIVDATLLSPPQSAAPVQRARGASASRRVLWTALGATGGFFAGGYVGAWIENTFTPCGCDDPGLTGALIGIPIGAVAGGVTGFLLSK